MQSESFKVRRDALLGDMQNGDVFVLFSGDSETIKIIPPDKNIVNRNFYYLTGIWETELVFVAICTGGVRRETLLIPAQSDMEVFYMGMSKDADYYRERYGFESVDYRHNLESIISMQAFSAGIHRLLIASANKTFIHRPTLESVFAQQMKASFPGIEIVDLNRKLLCMRQFKDADEVANISKAVDLAGMAIEANMRQLRPGMTEAQALAIANYAVCMNGGEGIPEGIVAAGRNAVTLHYCGHDGLFQNGELVMLDLAAKYNHYCCDITRTFPLNGRFTERQAFWYDLCYTAQQLTVKAMKPGANMRACGEEARSVMAEALIREGIIHRPEELPQMIGAGRKDFVTCAGVNHSIGMDPDETGCCDLFTELQPGMVYTVEPGVYLASEGIGLRVEDDYLVTDDGVICLSDGIPASREAIERAIARLRNAQC